MKRGAESAKVFSRDMKQIGTQASQVGLALTRTLTLPIVAAGVAVVKAAVDFETSFAGVRKTVQATEPEFAAMAAQFRELAKTIPVNVNEINRLAEAAGALGIPKGEIVEFARVMALLGVTTNLTSDQAAEGIAKIQNIFGAAGKDTDRFAATLVALGNDGASTESQILEMATRISGAGHAINLSQGEVMAFASALSSVGIEAEMGGSAISRVFIEIAKAVSDGGKELEGFARVAGKPVAEFARLFKEDAATATNAFIQGLHNVKTSGGDLIKTLEQLGFTEIRVRDTLLRAAGAGDLLTRALELQKTAWQSNTALTEEARERFQTTASQLTLLWNRVKDVGITIGTALLPAIKSTISALDSLIPLIDALGKGFATLPTPVQGLALGLVALVAAAGPAIYIFGQLALAGSAIAGAFTKTGIATRLLMAVFGQGGMAAGLFGRALGLVAGPIGWIIGVTAAIVSATSTWDELFRILKAGGEILLNVVGRGFQLFIDLLGPVIRLLGQLVSFIDDIFGISDSIRAMGRAFEIALGWTANSLERLSRWLRNVPSDASQAQSALDRLREAGIKPLASHGVAVAGALGAVSTAVAAATDRFAALGVSLSAAEAEIAKLSDSARSNLTKAIQSGVFTMQELETATGLSSMAIKLFTDRIKAAEKPVDDLKEALAKIRRAQIPLTAQQEALARGWREMGLSAGDIAKALQVSEVAISNYFESLDTGVERFEQSLDRSTDAVNDARKAVEAGLVPWIKTLRVQLGDTTLEATRFAGAMFLVNAASATVGSQFRDATPFERFRDSLSQIVDALGVVGDRWASVAAGILRNSQAIIQMWSGQRDPDTGELIPNTRNRTAAVGTAIGAIGEFIPTNTTRGRIAQGATRGAAIGSTFGPIGMGIGAGVGALIGWIQSGRAHRQVNDVRDAFIEWSGGLHTLNVRARAAGLALNSLLDARTPEQFEQAMQALTEGIENHEEKIRKAVGTLASGFNSMAVALEGDAVAVDALGRSALTTFGLLIAQGATWSEALSEIQPGLAALRQTYEDLGIEIQDSALQALLMQSTILDANPALIAGIDSLAGQFEALATLGLLNADTFADMELIGMRMYNRLQGQVAAVGGTTRDALLPMQTWLHEAQIRAEELGIPLDDNTQMLIDQSIELGIWRERGRTANELMLDGLTAIVDKLDEFMRRLLGLPDSVETTVNTNYTTTGTPPSGTPPGGTPPDQRDPFNPYGSAGGLVTALGIQRRPAYLRVGGMIPRGTDTVPAMLTPGEVVLTRGHQDAVKAALAQAWSGGHAKYEIHVHSHLNGRVVAEEVIQDFPGAAMRLGLT